MLGTGHHKLYKRVQWFSYLHFSSRRLRHPGASENLISATTPALPLVNASSCPSLCDVTKGSYTSPTSVTNPEFQQEALNGGLIAVNNPAGYKHRPFKVAA